MPKREADRPRASAVRGARPAHARAKQPRRARGSLSREEILSGASELIELHGLRELSMPDLARHLKSGVTSIYWYFRSKDDLLVALAQHVTAELYARLPEVGTGPWDEELEAYFSAFRDEAWRNPVFLELFGVSARFLMSRPAVAQQIVRRLEDEISILVRAGLTPVQAASLYEVCSAYTRGFVLVEHGLVSERPAAGVDDILDRAVAALDPVAFPTLTRLPSFRRAMFPDESQFRLGLRLLIDGARQRFPVLCSGTTTAARNA